VSTIKLLNGKIQTAARHSFKTESASYVRKKKKNRRFKRVKDEEKNLFVL